MASMKLVDIIRQGDNRSVIIKKNIIGTLLVKGCSIIISLLLVPLTLGYLSSELYGIWLTLSSIMLWLNFFDIGFTLGLKNKLTEAIALDQWERGRALVSTTYFMMIIIFIPLCIVLEMFVPIINWGKFLNVSESYNVDIQKTLNVLILCFCLQMIVNVLSAIIAAFQRVALSSVFPVIGNFLSLLAILFLTKYSSPSLFSLSIAISIMPIIVLAIASIVLFSSRYKTLSPSCKYVNMKYIHDLFGLGFKFFIIQIQVVVMFQTTNILISNLSGPNEVTAYNIAYKYLGIALMLFNIILSPLWPAFTDAYTRKDYVWMRRIYSKMIKLYMLSVIGVLIMVIFSSLAYKLWIGSKAEIPFIMTLLVALYVLVHSWDSLQVIILNGIGVIKLQTYVTTIGLIFHIPLSYLLGKYIEGYGVIVSMTLITMIYLSFFTLQVKRILNNTANGIWIK